MGLNEKQKELIGLYLQGRLKGDERTTFLDEVAQNPELKEELDIQQAIHDGIEHKQNQDLRERLIKISSESKTSKIETKVKPMRIMRIVSAIAAVVLLCFAAYFLLDSPTGTDDLYADNFIPTELTITRSTDLEDDLVAIKELYNTQKYDQVLPLFQKLITQDPTAANLRIAYGNALMKCNKLNLAKTQFDYIIDSKDPLYIDQANWYLGLVQLKSGSIDSAKTYFEKLADDENSDYHSEAQSMLNKLEDLES